MPPHDRLFKTLLRAFFADLLRLTAPGVYSRAALARIVFLDKELLTGSGRREADLLARVPLRGGGSLLIHVEVEARSHRRMPHRLRAYASRIQAGYDAQVLSIVLYIRGGEPGIRWHDLAGEVKAPEITAFRYVAFSLVGCPAADFLARPEPLAWALAALMDRGSASRLELRLSCLRRIGAAKLPMERQAILADFVDAYLPLTADEEKQYKVLDADKSEEGQAMWMTWSERMKAEGELRALRRVAVHLIEQRFGPVPQKVRNKVESTKSIPRLNGLLERVLTASSLEDLGLVH